MFLNTGRFALRLELDPESAFASSSALVLAGLIGLLSACKKGYRFLASAAIRNTASFLLASFLVSALLHHGTHLLPEGSPVKDQLLQDSVKIARRPINSEPRRQIPGECSQHDRHHDHHHLLLRWIHAALRSDALHHEHG